MAIVSPTRQPRRPSDLLGERRAVAKRFLGESTPPTIKEFEQHAQRFGDECVVETAIELGHSFESCVRLQDACDRIESARYMREHPRARPPKLAPSEDRVRVLMGIEKTGDDG